MFGWAANTASTSPAGSGAAPDLVELARIVAQQRAELDRLREQAATSCVVERGFDGAARALGGTDAAHSPLLLTPDQQPAYAT
ncbi:hypothetical protein, partial [Streptomyces sp. NPDC004976]